MEKGDRKLSSEAFLKFTAENFPEFSDLAKLFYDEEKVRATLIDLPPDDYVAVFPESLPDPLSHAIGTHNEEAAYNKSMYAKKQRELTEQILSESIRVNAREQNPRYNEWLSHSTFANRQNL